MSFYQKIHLLNLEGGGGGGGEGAIHLAYAHAAFSGSAFSNASLVHWCNGYLLQCSSG